MNARDPSAAAPASVATSPQARYEQLLAARGHRADDAQRLAIGKLQQLADALRDYRPSSSRAPAAASLGERIAARARRRIGSLFGGSRPAPRGVWMHGGVGRGKSFLMDCFFETVAVERKTRIHFHEFMRGIHRELRELRSVADPLDEVARRVAMRHWLICFDEFHLSDIADAMILERLLDGLFAHGVVFVMTSNYRPDDLYPGGLHRDRVLPAIELLKSRLDVVAVDAGTDYRRLALQSVDTYLTPLDAAADAKMKAAFERIAESADEDPALEIENRRVRALRRAGGVVWFDFETLCEGPRSQNDYLELATQFHTVLLSGVPRMDARMASAARRFTWLVDVLYDQRVKLVMSAQVGPAELYPHGPMAHEFARTASRLAEMQSSEYLDAPRRGVAERIT
ncbi:MAG: cell division protein ZapE [Lautropia sp.]